jgi:hypothetical protein
MSNIYDQAVVAWANDRLIGEGFPPDATDLRFGSWTSCWSSITHDFGVSATITRADGSEVELTDVWDLWDEVLRALPAYIEAIEETNRLHAEAHTDSGDDD